MISVVIVGMLSLMGVFALVLQGDGLQRTTLFLVSFAVGGLLGDAFIHLTPKSFAQPSSKLFASLYALTEHPRLLRAGEVCDLAAFSLCAPRTAR